MLVTEKGQRFRGFLFFFHAKNLRALQVFEPPFPSLLCCLAHRLWDPRVCGYPRKKESYKQFFWPTCLARGVDVGHWDRLGLIPWQL